jgi:hypothetical protein
VTHQRRPKHPEGAKLQDQDQDQDQAQAPPARAPPPRNPVRHQAPLVANR